MFVMHNRFLTFIFTYILYNNKHIQINFLSHVLMERTTRNLFSIQCYVIKALEELIHLYY